MEKLDWKKIDDHEFVYLCADILRSLGFTDVQVHGDGPDGGLDLIATELLQFTIQGSQSFRWGIQCKFSKTGKRRAVNDNEVRDITGVLGSDRYLINDLKGYMILTNRRISQNVIERLSGVNRRSSYRTASIDGTRLKHLLLERPKIVEKYFGGLKTEIIQLGEPFLIANLDKTSRYIAEVEVISPTSTNLKVKCDALIDTGATMSCIPISILEDLNPLTNSIVLVRSTDSHVTKKSTYLVNFKMGNIEFKRVEVIGINQDYVLLGQNVLKDTSILIDGTTKRLKLYSTY